MRITFRRCGYALAFAALLGLLLVGCETLGVFTPKAQQDIQKISAVLAPFIGDAQKVVANIQQNYSFYYAVLNGTLQVAGVKIPPEAADLARNWLAAADTTLKIAAPVTVAIAQNQPVPAVDPNLLQLGIIQAQTVLPKEAKAAMANPAVAALYAAYVAGQSNLPAPANPTPASSDPTTAPAS